MLDFDYYIQQGECPFLTNSDTQLVSLKGSEKIVRLMREMPLITAQDLAEEISISRRAVEKNIVRLKTSGRIQRVGPDKGGHWKVL